MTIDNPILTRADVAKLLQVSERTILRYVKNAGMPYMKINGGRILFETASVLEWVRSNLQKNTPSQSEKESVEC